MNWTFLVADNNDADRESTVVALRRFSPGANIWAASTGDAAIEILDHRRTVPSLVVIESDLGDMTGLDLLGEMRSRRWLDRAPVIFLARPMVDRQAARCYQLGVLTVLAKPLSQYELRQAIREFAREARVLSASTVLSGSSTVHSAAA